MERLLIVVDYQNDFVDGSLGFSGAEKLDSRIADKIREYQLSGSPVVYTKDTHEENYLETKEGRNLPVRHCVRGTKGHELYGEAGRLLRDMRGFEKRTFGSENLFRFLQKRPFDSIELVGLVSNICVISNAILAQVACPEAIISVDAACTASFDPDLNAKTLDILEGLQIVVTNR